MKKCPVAAASSVVVIYPRGQLGADDAKRLADAGIVAVEAADPHLVRVLPMPLPLPLPAVQPVPYDDMLLALMTAIERSRVGSIAMTFVETLLERLRARESRDQELTIRSAPENAQGADHA